jgi:hypothetical protein
VRRWTLGTSNDPVEGVCPQRVKPVATVVKRFPARPKRTVAATFRVAGQTLREAEAGFWFQANVIRGLYGGKLALTRDGFALARYSLAPGVLLTGKLALVGLGPPSTFKGTVKVSGSAAVAGTLKVAKNGRITGTLGGRRVSASY